MESSSSSTEAQGSEARSKQENCKIFHLFNCDRTYSLESVEKLLKSIETKVDGFGISSVQRYFDLHSMADVCDSIMSEPQMDFAIFVVHANESRLSINENNAGIGYAMIYGTLMKKTDEKVIIVIGGDDNYKDLAEEQSSVLSRWAYRKVASQFEDKLLDGRKSFIFSWDKEHRPIHEEAMIHFLDPEEKEEKFFPKPIPVAAPLSDVTAKADEDPSYSNTETPASDEHKIQTGSEQDVPALEHRGRQKIEAKQADSLESPTSSDENVNADEAMEQDSSEDDFVNVDHDDFQREDPLALSCPARLSSDHDASENGTTPQVNVAILYRDPSDMAFIADVFGELVKHAVLPISSNDPSDLSSFLRTNQVRSCFIMLEAGNLKTESRYTDLLKTARQFVDKKVIVILCDSASQNEEEEITATIARLLGEKGTILCLKKTPQEYELVLQTRLRNGNISYEEQDVQKREGGWKVPENVAKDLSTKWKTTPNAELQISRNSRDRNLHVTVNPEGGDGGILGGVARKFYNLAQPFYSVYKLASCKSNHAIELD